MDEKAELDKKGEKIKADSDKAATDYLTNLRSGLEGYMSSINRYMDDFNASLDKHKEEVLAQIDDQVSAINRRMSVLSGKVEEAKEPPATVKEKEEADAPQPRFNNGELKAVLQQIRILLGEIEKGIEG